MSTLLMVAYGIDPGFLRACDQTLQVVLTACRFITPSLMGIALLYTIGRGFISGSGLAMDWGPIIKATWIFFLLFFYQTLVDTLGTGLAAFTALHAVTVLLDRSSHRDLEVFRILEEAIGVLVSVPYYTGGRNPR